MLAVLVPVVAICGLAWPLTPRRRALRLSCFAAVYLVLELSMVTVCAWHWLCRLGRHQTKSEWRLAHTRLLGWALTVLLGAADTLLRFRVEVTEPVDLKPLEGHEPVLVLARHGGPGDSLAIVHLLIERYGRSVRIVLKELLAIDPALDILLTRLNCVFVPAGSRGRSATSLLTHAAADLSGTETLLLFPEGNNWTPDRRARVIDRLRSRRDRKAEVAQQLEYVLPPRPAGALACFRTRPDLPIVFVAHTGLEELVSVRDGWEHLPFETPMSVRWWKSDTRPASADDQAMADWLVTEWAIIDEWIGTQADKGHRLVVRPLPETIASDETP